MTSYKDELTILFEDNHCLVVVKPSGVSTGRDHRGERSFIEIVQTYVQEAARERGKQGYLAPIHFLDRPVTGVMLFAKSSKAATRLNEQMRSKQVKKSYLAVVEGEVPGAGGVLRDFLLKDHDKNFVKTVPEGTAEARACELNYERLFVGEGRSLLIVKPVTGRSHQIRVQLSHQGWPICGDTKYGAASKGSAQGGIFLHAVALSYKHPTSGQLMHHVAPPNPSWLDTFPILQRPLTTFLQSQ